MASVSRETTLHRRVSAGPGERVKDACLCLAAQRAARALARRFDAAFRPIGLTSGQFSLLMALNRPTAPSLGAVADVLAMDRTTLTAALKPLERRGLVAVKRDETDRRARRLLLTTKGRALLAKAVPIWRLEHRHVERGVAGVSALRRGLSRLASYG